MRLQILFCTVICIGLLSLFSCNRAENEIEISLVAPMTGDSTVQCKDVMISANFAALETNHFIRINFHSEGTDIDSLIFWDVHDHEQETSYEQIFDLCSYPSGTCFHLEIDACIDHECTRSETRDVSFCIE